MDLWQPYVGIIYRLIFHTPYINRSIETRDGKRNHQTCKLYSKKGYSSNFGDKISSKDKIISIAQTHNHVKENSIPLLRYCVVEEPIKSAGIEKAKDGNKEENKH